jgi:hypothetical protein
VYTAKEARRLCIQPKSQTIVDSPFVFGKNNSIGNTTNVNGKNPLSYIVSIDGSDRLFPSQADLSRATGISEPNISKHLNHGKPLPDGMSVTRRGIAL